MNALSDAEFEALVDGLTDAIMGKVEQITKRLEERIAAIESQLGTKGAGLAARLKDGSHTQR